MRTAVLALTCLLGGATPVTVPIGEFRTWRPSKIAPLDVTSGGLAIHVAALSCPPKPIGDSACRWNGYNNQGIVTVSAPAMAPSTVTTDGASGYARVAVVRFDARDGRPGVIVESQSGGSGGAMAAQFLIPSGDGYRVLRLGSLNATAVQGALADHPTDLSGDGRIDLKLTDARFESAFGCNACTPRPPKLFAVKDGQIVDESGDPSLRHVFAAEMQQLAPGCLSTIRDRNGACAAYVADAARAGRFAEAWAKMLAHYEHGAAIWEPCLAPPSAWIDHRCPERYATHYRDFPQSLHAFLIRTGYLPTAAHRRRRTAST